MTDPAPYTVTYSFSDFQANSPTMPLPALKVDNELANIATAVSQLDSAIKDVRSADGTLKNGIVTFNSLALGLQLTVDPTNGQAVAAAVAGAQASQTAAAGSATAAANSATASANSATAAAASASSVNLNAFLTKAGNLAGLGNPDNARAAISGAKVDGSDMIGRLAPLTGQNVTDWNSVASSGWFCGIAAANAPDTTGTTWLVHAIAIDAFTVTQIAHNMGNANGGVSAVNILRRVSYNNGGVRTWQPWCSADPVPVGSTIWINNTVAPPGYLKENGALLSRAQFPALWAFASNSGSLTTEAGWAAGNTGAFSNGDLVTTFRLPDARGEFIRAYDDGRGVDSGRGIYAHQADLLRDHTHSYTAPGVNVTTPGGGFAAGGVATGATTSGASVGGAETRPRNNAKLACIKY